MAAGVVLGQAALASRRPDRAEAAMAEATAAARAANLRQPTLIAWSHLDTVQQLRGAQQTALASVRSALAWAAERGTSTGQGPTVLSAQLVGLLLDADEIGAARPFAEEALLELSRLAHMQLPSLLTRLAVVRLRVAEGDLRAALDLVHEAGAALSPGSPAQPLVAAAEAAVRMALGDGDAAARWASSVEPLVLPPPLGLQTHLFAAAVEAFGVTPARVLVGHGLTTGDPAVLHAAANRVEHLRRLGQEYGLGALERTGTVVSRTDWIGSVILVGFIAAQVARGWLLGHWAEELALTTLGLCVTAGTLIGQVVGTRSRVRAARPEDGAGR